MCPSGCIVDLVNPKNDGSLRLSDASEANRCVVTHCVCVCVCVCVCLCVVSHLQLLDALPTCLNIVLLPTAQ